MPILGADFLKNFHLLPDLTEKRLYDGATLCSTRCKQSYSSVSSVNLVTDFSEAKINTLFEKFPTLLRPPQYKENPNHDVEHFIHTKGPPVHSKARRLRPDVELKVRHEFQSMVEKGICSPSSSEWSSPLVVVQKDDNMRMVGDYRRVNERTTADRYPLPDLRDCTDRLEGKTIFSKVDLIRAYYFIPVFKKHRKKTAIITPAGLFEYNRMPFGLKNAPATFQRFLNSVLSGLDFIFCYLDDIFIFSSNESEHIEHLKILFERLSRYGLAINQKKCKFFVLNVDFLGYQISENVFQPTEERVRYIRNLAKPRTITALRRVIGLLNFYRRFCRRAAEYLAPFNEILKGHPKKNDRSPVPWTPQLEEKFQQTCAAFADYTLLHFPKNGAELRLCCDASGVAIGAVLEQIVDGERQPLGFYSAKLDERQQQWSAYDRELYAIYSAVDHFSYLVEGRPFTIVTDHRPLCHLFTTQKHQKIERRSRWTEFISQFSTDIVHTSGVSNVVADALSRPDAEVNLISTVPLSSQIATAQQQDEEIQRMRSAGFRQHVLKEVLDEHTGISMLCSEFQGRLRPIVPAKMRRDIFQKMHSIDHLGKKATMKKIGMRYFWPGMNRDVKSWIKTCPSCQKVKTQRHTVSELQPFPPSDRFEHVHIDIVVLSLSRGYRYLLTMIDRATQWIEVIPIKDMTAKTVASAFVESWVSRYGIPLKLTSDRGAQFQSSLFSELCSLLGTNQISTSALNAKANGMIERIHRRLKEGFKALGSSDWLAGLPMVLLGLRAAPKDDNGISCAEMAFGRSLILPGEFCNSQTTEIRNESEYVQKLRQAIRRISPKQVKWNSNRKIFVHKDLHTCKKVYVRVDRVKAPLELPYEGPFEVLSRKPKYFILLKDGKKDAVSIDRLKPAYELAGDEIVEPEKKIDPILKLEDRGKRVSFYANVSNDLFSNLPIPPTPPPPPTPSLSNPVCIPSTSNTSSSSSTKKRVTFQLPKTRSKTGCIIKKPERFGH